MKSWEAAPEEMGLEATVEDSQTVLMWHAAEDRSRHKEQQLGNLGRQCVCTDGVIGNTNVVR